jgi:hypothetical protein
MYELLERRHVFPVSQDMPAIEKEASVSTRILHDPIPRLSFDAYRWANQRHRMIGFCERFEQAHCLGGEGWFNRFIGRTLKFAINLIAWSPEFMTQRIIDRATQKDAAMRYQSTAEMRRELEIAFRRAA